jgi:hypothetical protein
MSSHIPGVHGNLRFQSGWRGGSQHFYLSQIINFLTKKVMDFQKIIYLVIYRGTEITFLVMFLQWLYG